MSINMRQNWRQNVSIQLKNKKKDFIQIVEA